MPGAVIRDVPLIPTMADVESRFANDGNFLRTSLKIQVHIGYFDTESKAIEVHNAFVKALNVILSLDELEAQL